MSGSGSRPGNSPIATYTWDFGDGGNGSGASVSHAYAAAGTYVVTLTVTDAESASGVAATTATVGESAPPAGQPVFWTEAVGVSASGSSLTKTGAGGYDAGAISTKALASGDGFLEFTASETTTYRIAGLSRGNTNQHYSDVDFGILLVPPSWIYIYEGGVSRGALATYASGDRLRVAVEGGVVRYRRNGNLIYTSTVPPAYPLLVDTSLYDTGATITNAALGGLLVDSVPAEAVTWKNAVQVAVEGSGLRRADHPAGWNAGAVSRKQILSGDGYVEFLPGETDTDRMLGLSNGDADQGQADIDFALLAAADGTLQVWEKGVALGTFGTYAGSDRLRVAVEGGLVKYSRNGTVFRTSGATPRHPLLVDTTLSTPGATLRNVLIAGRQAEAEAVSWTGEVNVTAAGSRLTKQAGTPGLWDAGAISTRALAAGDGFVEFTVPEATTGRMLGLSQGNSDQDYPDLDYGLYPTAGGGLYVYEKGAGRGQIGTYAAGDRLRVAVEGGSVKYRRNGTLLYSSTVPPAYPLLVDAALYSTGATLANVVLVGELQ
jgi:PKD repeat protein